MIPPSTFVRRARRKRPDDPVQITRQLISPIGVCAPASDIGSDGRRMHHAVSFSQPTGTSSTWLGDRNQDAAGNRTNRVPNLVSVRICLSVPEGNTTGGDHIQGPTPIRRNRGKMERPLDMLEEVRMSLRFRRPSSPNARVLPGDPRVIVDDFFSLGLLRPLRPVLLEGSELSAAPHGSLFQTSPPTVSTTVYYSFIPLVNSLLSPFRRAMRRISRSWCCRST